MFQHSESLHSILGLKKSTCSNNKPCISCNTSYFKPNQIEYWTFFRRERPGATILNEGESDAEAFLAQEEMSRTSIDLPLTLFETGGVQQPPTVNQPWGPKNCLQMTPNFVTFPISIWPIWKSQKNCFFTMVFGVWKGVVLNTPPHHHLTFIF